MSKVLDEKGICFIICSNNSVYVNECLYYINHLFVPDGYRIDVLTVEDAKSMTAGYNEAMHYSGAKYKVYLHQDVFIVNPNFIQDFLQIFWEDEKIGMIGMIGSASLPKSGVMWEGERYGVVYQQHIYKTVLVGAEQETLTEVEVVDGLLMITQYDIAWREDLFDKWDFYDCSQSMEFRKKGYKVVVPAMKKPWCLHDCGANNFEHYDEERKKFLEEYGDGTENRC